MKEGFTQMLRGAQRPVGDHGGVNPMQVGLGMAVGSIDSIMEQGSLQSTGQITDLAIEGRGFFAFTNGRGGTFYSRNGALQLNAQGYLVSPTNGMNLLGLTADSSGVIRGSALPGPIKIPFTDKLPARATEEITFACNLNANGMGRGSWIHTASFFTSHELDTTAGRENTLLTGLFDHNGNSLNIRENDELRVAFTDATGTTVDQTFRVVAYNSTPAPDPTDGTVATLEDLRRAIEIATGGAPVVVDITPDGRLEISGVGNTAGISDVTNLAVRNITRPTSDGFVANVFQWPDALAGATHTSIGGLLTAANEDTPLHLVRDSNGRGLGLENGDQIRVNANVGNTALPPCADGGLMFSDGGITAGSVGPATTIGDLMFYMQTRLRLPDLVPTDSGEEVRSLQINNAADGDLRAPVGSLVIRGQVGSAFSITGLSINATNATPNTPPPSAFNANMNGTQFQANRDVEVHSTSIEVFDNTGASHTLMMTFTHSGIPGEWLWEITPREGQLILSGNHGRLSFAPDGSPASLEFADGSTDFRFDPRNDSGEMAIRLNVGFAGSHLGITQFESPTTTAIVAQDGYPMGQLLDISITETGEINGLYSSGISRTLAQILVAEFQNPAGLLRTGDSMWAESHNSGNGVLLRAGSSSKSSIKPGALEMSNVDLAAEFTDLIKTQRGYQSNARIISTSDSLLQELVNLVR